MSRYDDFDPGVRLYRQRCLEIHNAKIQTVKKVLDIQESSDRLSSKMVSFRYQRKKNNDFHQKNRNMMLTQENQKLVQKIEGIHFRPPKFQQEGKSDKQRRVSSNNKRGSLNYFTRKQENDRIYRENMILFSKLKESKAILSKRDFDDHYASHKRYMQTVSKANQIEQNILAQAAQGHVLARSPSKAYMTSQRSVTTLPPIHDIKSPRKSVPISHTPKLAANSGPDFQGSPPSMRLATQLGESTSALPSATQKQGNSKTLPKISSHPEDLHALQASSQLLHKPVLKKRDQRQSHLSGAVTGNRGSNMRNPQNMFKTQINSPLGLQSPQQIYRGSGTSVRELNVGQTGKKRRKKSKRAKQTKLFDVSMDGKEGQSSARLMEKETPRSPDSGSLISHQVASIKVSSPRTVASHHNSIKGTRKIKLKKSSQRKNQQSMQQSVPPAQEIVEGKEVYNEIQNHDTEFLNTEIRAQEVNVTNQSPEGAIEVTQQELLQSASTVDKEQEATAPVETLENRETPHQVKTQQEVVQETSQEQVEQIPQEATPEQEPEMKESIEQKSAQEDQEEQEQQEASSEPTEEVPEIEVKDEGGESAEPDAEQ